MSVVLPFIYMTLVIKWWIVAALVMLAFAFATPDYLVDEHFNRDFAQSPKIIVEGITNIFRAGGSETTVRVSSAKKWLGRLRAKFFEEKGRG